VVVVRKLTVPENAAFVEMLNEGQFYPQLDAGDLMGTECYGTFNDDGLLLGGVMIIRQGTHAYLDYLYFPPEYRNRGHGVRLLEVVRRDLKEDGVRYVYASINGVNQLSGRLALRHRGKIGFPYLHVRVDLEEHDGKHNIDI